jgi:hypothetical protein
MSNGQVEDSNSFFKHGKVIITTCIQSCIAKAVIARADIKESTGVADCGDSRIV